MDWRDLVLRLIRGAGALTSAIAGIAALLTDGAFHKKTPPPTGRWKDFPLAKYSVTAWGAFLLAVILLAPAIQFVGDWVKDRFDAETLQTTVGNLQSDIKNTVNTSTAQAKKEIVVAVRTEGQAQLSAAQQLNDQTSQIATGAGHILDDVDRIMERFDEITIDVLYEYPTKDGLPGMNRIIELCDNVIGKVNSHSGYHQLPGFQLVGNDLLTTVWGLEFPTKRYADLLASLGLQGDESRSVEGLGAVVFANSATSRIALGFTKSRLSDGSVKRNSFYDLGPLEWIARASGLGDRSYSDLIYSQATKRVFIQQIGHHFQGKDLKTSAKFGSINDLGGAFVYVMIDDVSQQQWEQSSLLAHLKPVWMRIVVSNQVVEVIHFKKIRGLPIYVAQLPTKQAILEGRTSIARGYVDRSLALP